jgi:hypothetical protein
MGCGPFKTCSNSYAVPNSNPDPNIFEIEIECRVGKFLILQVRYPSCKNYEGRKIIVYEFAGNSKDLLDTMAGKLDPHFDANAEVKVFARFAPTADGLKAAISLASIR